MFGVILLYIGFRKNDNAGKYLPMIRKNQGGQACTGFQQQQSFHLSSHEACGPPYQTSGHRLCVQKGSASGTVSVHIGFHLFQYILHHLPISAAQIIQKRKVSFILKDFIGFINIYIARSPSPFAYHHVMAPVGNSCIEGIVTPLKSPQMGNYFNSLIQQINWRLH